jgi:hypothetical protein
MHARFQRVRGLDIARRHVIASIAHRYAPKPPGPLPDRMPQVACDSNHSARCVAPGFGARGMNHRIET